VRLHATFASYGTKPLRRAGHTPALNAYRRLPAFALLSVAGGVRNQARKHHFVQRRLTNIICRQLENIRFDSDWVTTKQEGELTRIIHEFDPPSIVLWFHTDNLQSVVIVDTTLLQKIPRGTNVLRDHRVNS